MTQRYYLNALVPIPGAHRYSQQHMLEDFSARISRLPDAAPVLDKAKTIYGNSEVDTRHLEFTIEDLDRRRDASGWHPIAKDAIISLGKRAIEKALESSGTRPEDCDALVVVASNYDGFPGPSRRLSEAFGFRKDAIFYDVATLGCGGANHGIQLAQMLLETGRCRTVCFVCVEILGTHIQVRRYETLPSVSQVVAHVLPSDGAAAMIFSRVAGARPVLSYRSVRFDLHSWPGSEGYMVAGTSNDGEPFGSLDKNIRTRLLDETSSLLTPEAIEEPMFIHGGGTALLRRLGEAIPRLSSAADLSAAILKENGNMSAPTVLHVLARALREGQSVAPRFRLLAFGPGVYSTLLAFDGVERAGA
jgi:alkylresorcinol/alkylpyrone synthase